MNNFEKKLPLVTVGITSFERPHTLKQTLQSVLNQTYKNIEVLVIDDCSLKNDIKSLMDKFTQIDERIKFFHRDNNCGVTENVNLMVKNAAGEYFLWLCDDDWIDANYIETCLAFIENNPAYSLVTGVSKFYVENKFLYEAKEINVEENSPKERFLSFHKQSLGTANSPNFGIVRTSLLRDVPLKNILGHDNVLLGNLSIAGKIKSLDSTYVHRRLGGMSETLSKMSRVCDYSFLEKHLSFLGLYLNITSDVVLFNSKSKQITFLDRILLMSGFTLDLIRDFKKTLSRYFALRSPGECEGLPPEKLINKKDVVQPELVEV